MEPKGLQKSITYQIVSTNSRDSVSFMIIGINQRVRDEDKILKNIYIFLKLHIYCFISESNFLQILKGFQFERRIVFHLVLSDETEHKS